MINVLIVDDDLMVAELNRKYLEQIPGFQCMKTVSELTDAKLYLMHPETTVNLILLDVFMRKESGLDLLSFIREKQLPVDIIMITSASDISVIKTARHHGVVDYLIKPFRFERFKEALLTYQKESQLVAKNQSLNQSELDALIHRNVQTPIASPFDKLPKGLTRLTLKSVCQWIQQHPDQQFSTDELAKEVGLSRVSCRKYLLYLSEIKLLKTDIFYGSMGRPVYLYQLDHAYMPMVKALIQ